MKKKILFCPLDWGLGHASRIIPIIREYEKEHTVLIACSEKIRAFYRVELPQHETILFENPEIRYSAGRFFFLKMLFQVPKLLFSTITEHFRLKKLIQEHAIDMVISDNRYGLWSKSCHSVFITHQLSPLTGTNLTNFLAKKMVAFFANRYHECWIPDTKDYPKISGKLSDNNHIKNVTYIGLLSRFGKPEIPEVKQQLLILLSGPEPQRTILENILIEKTKDLSYPKIVLRGKPDETQLPFAEGFTFYNHLKTNELELLIAGSQYIVCRSGYSSIMDLITLGKTALLIPTPHQYEQEYLANHLKELSLFDFQKQDEISFDPDFYNTDHV